MTMNPPYRILIVEDHALLCEGIRRLLATQTHYVIVGVVDNGLDVYKSCLQLKPDIVLLDLSLPGMDGVDIISQIYKRWEQQLPIIVLTATENRLQESFKAGAQSYILKRSPYNILLTAMKHVISGKEYIDPNLGFTKETNKTRLNLDHSLTTRERQTLKLIAEGKRNRDISELLSVSLKTVETHRFNLMRKLDAHNAAELSLWAHRLGIINV